MNNKEALNTLNDIKSMMEKSTKFLSLNGLSSICIGFYALTAACGSYLIFRNEDPTSTNLLINTPYKLQLILLFAALLVLLCLATTFAFSYRKAKKEHRPLRFDKTAKRLLWNFFLPLSVGGILCLSLIHQQHYGLTSSIMLIFYGLALINASTYTYSNTKYLGYAELTLGLLDSFIQGYALLFWGIGFGLFHILYGILFYSLYDRKSFKEASKN